MFQKTTLVFALALVCAFGQAPPPAGGRGGSGGGRGGFGGPAIKSPEVSTDGKLTARLRAPNAKEVLLVVGNQRVPLTKDDRGVWSGTSDVLKPDVYMYQFSVDGMTVNDPSNPNLATSFGTGGRSVVTVPGSVAWAPVASVAKGAVTRFTYRSDVAGDDRDFYVYTPAGYDPKRKEAYPVLYLLHGLGDDAQSWLTQGNANVVLDNLIAQGKAKPMIMVNPLGYGHAGGGQGAPDMLVHFADALLNEVMPRVEKEFNVAKDRDHRAIAGLSMGGMQAFQIAFNHLDTFSYIGGFSGSGGLMAFNGNQFDIKTVYNGALADPDAFAKRVHLVWIGVGTEEPKMMHDGILHFNDELTQGKVKHVFYESPGTSHEWQTWRRDLKDFAPRLFQ